MKKLFVILFSLALLTGCGSDNETKTDAMGISSSPAAHNPSQDATFNEFRSKVANGQFHVHQSYTNEIHTFYKYEANNQSYNLATGFFSMNFYMTLPADDFRRERHSSSYIHEFGTSKQAIINGILSVMNQVNTNTSSMFKNYIYSQDKTLVQFQTTDGHIYALDFLLPITANPVVKRHMMTGAGYEYQPMMFMAN